MGNLGKGYMDWIKLRIQDMIQEDYGLDEEYRQRLANCTEEDLIDMVEELINNYYINEQVNGIIEYMLNRRFGNEI